MKTLLMTAFCSVVIKCVASGMSGSVYFANRIPPVIDTPFYDEDGVFLSGPEYVTQLYAWKVGEGFLPICFPVAFVSDGYFRGKVISIPFVEEAHPAWIQIRAWEMAGGATFEDAALAGVWSGTSEVLYLPFLGSGDVPCREDGSKMAPGGSGERIGPLGVPFFPADLHGLTYPGPPLVVRQPESRTITVRDQAQLSVVASSGVGAFYQWHQSPSDAPYGLIPGATNATYTTPRLVSNTTYWVSIRNAGGATVSDPAAITVDGPALTPRLTVPRILPWGEVEMLLEGEPGVEYEVQYRTAVSGGEWIPLTRRHVEPLWNKVLISQPLSPNSPARFYRAVALP